MNRKDKWLLICLMGVALAGYGAGSLAALGVPRTVYSLAVAELALVVGAAIGLFGSWGLRGDSDVE